MHSFVLIISSILFLAEAACINFRQPTQTQRILVFNLRKASHHEAKSLWNLRTNAIRGIDKQYYPKDDLEKWAPSEMPEDFSEAVICNEWHVIEMDGEIIACGFVDLKGSTLEAIFVSPPFQGQGFAKKMLEHLEAIAKEHGLKELSLSATLNAEGFYQKHGYHSKEKSIWVSPRGVNLACVKMVKKIK